MTQKVLRVGSSAAVTIPKKSLKDLGLKIGDEVDVKVDKKNKTVQVRFAARPAEKNTRIAELTLNFIKRYRKDLEALARQ